MKELYLGLAITAFIVLILTITVEVSSSGSYLNSGKKRVEKAPTTSVHNVSNNSLNNSRPSRVYNKNNLNNLFLEDYYKNVNYNPENNYYVPN